MDEAEIIVLMISLAVSIFFFIKWYGRIVRSCLPERNRTARVTLCILPLLSFLIIFYTLRVLASFDVINDFGYITLYILLGYAWVGFGMYIIFPLFDISWADDVLNSNNEAALWVVTGGFLGLTAIYSGANIGDGPGWWCVIIAGGLGLVAWFILGFIANRLNHVLERVTIGRDLGCGIRFGGYMLAAGIILGRACAGDWTSFSQTIIELKDGWPVLCLAALEAITEHFYFNRGESETGQDGGVTRSVIWAGVFIVFAIISVVLLPPLSENPLYSVMNPLLSIWRSI